MIDSLLVPAVIRQFRYLKIKTLKRSQQIWRYLMKVAVPNLIPVVILQLRPLEIRIWMGVMKIRRCIMKKTHPHRFHWYHLCLIQTLLLIHPVLNVIDGWKNIVTVSEWWFDEIFAKMLFFNYFYCWISNIYWESFWFFC